MNLFQSPSYRKLHHQKSTGNRCHSNLRECPRFAFCCSTPRACYPSERHSPERSAGM